MGGTGQASDYLLGMWREALNKYLPSPFEAKRILMLGLAIGNTLPIYHKRFPKAHITAIEYDPVMVRFMDEHKTYAPAPRPTVLVEDALLALPKLTGIYDLIIVDIFDGKAKGMTPVIGDPTFWPNIARLVHKHGIVIFNSFKEPHLVARLPKELLPTKKWKYYCNTLFMLRPPTAGVVGAPLPVGYERLSATRAFLEREYADHPTHALISSGEACGIRKSLFGIKIELYFGDTEPKLTPDTTRRFVMWHPTTRTEKPSGWHRFFTRTYRRKTGFHDLAAENEYWKTWSSQAQRHRITWKKQTLLRVEPISADAYLQAYKTTSTNFILLRLFVHSITRYAAHQGERLHCYGVRNAAGTIIAGFCALDIPETKLSLHVTSFHNAEARKTSAAAGLIDAWFADEKVRGYRFLDFDAFWEPGDPASWKGFSHFKAQFGVHFIRYPKPLWRWMGKKKT